MKNFTQVDLDSLRSKGVFQFDEPWLDAIRVGVDVCFDEPASETPRSWLGGSPKLTAGTVWPSHGNTGMDFIAQLDLAGIAEIAPELGFPLTGYLVFFCFSRKQPAEKISAREYCRVLYFPVNAALVWTESPYYRLNKGNFMDEPLAIRMARALTLPSPNDEASFPPVYGINPFDDGIIARDQIPHIPSFPSSFLTKSLRYGRIGGYPEFLQPGAFAAFDADPQVLLLQFRDGGDGHWYFFARESALARRDFTNCELYYDTM